MAIGDADASTLETTDGPPPLGAGRYPPDAPVDEDAYHDVLRNPRRRATIAYLQAAETPVDVSTLADHVASVEAEGAPDDRLHKSVYVSLRQTHLPRLADHDVVAFDPDRNEVADGPAIDTFGGRSTPSSRPPWTFVLLGLLAVSWLVGSILGVVTLLDDRIVLVALGYVLLIYVEGLWEVYRLRSAYYRPHSDGR